jgi:hypothetical protein
MGRDEGDRSEKARPVGKEGGNPEREKQSVYLDPTRLDDRRLAGSNRESGSTGADDIFARWQAMNRALAADAAKFDDGSWQHDGKGVDIANLGQAAQGFLGSTRAHGANTLTLEGGSGTNLQDFNGLKEGMKRLG